LFEYAIGTSTVVGRMLRANKDARGPYREMLTTGQSARWPGDTHTFANVLSQRL